MVAAVGADRRPVIRTCVACRSLLPKAKLLRVVLEDGRPRVDIDNRASGRGAYICAEIECLQKARIKKGVFDRSFRQSLARDDLEVFFDGISGVLNAREGKESVVDKTLNTQNKRNN